MMVQQFVVGSFIGGTAGIFFLYGGMRLLAALNLTPFKNVSDEFARHFLLAVLAILSVPALGVLILWIVTTFATG